MIILSKLADYAVILATHLAAAAPDQVNAMHLAADTRLPQTTVAKVLKLLAKAGIVTALRGAAGGYRLARAAELVSVAEVIAAIDGSFGMTQCTSTLGPCERLHFCPTRPHWHRINEAVIQALAQVTLDEMTMGSLLPTHHRMPSAQLDFEGVPS
jgi:FeS assembly SUF system regulator